ncbi:serine acetyltransferase [Streptomyces sp. 549]|uniref:serine O-acetyltransferase EpsC n=1 Tax=Streptomyces sp. 549 TaxID=3049076 RepID=UPI0024C2FCF3|nr:serine O-acetyltransferase EpsC [Streptomyces sp. 549]MDK1475894.1 serine acetyltransferase [Streptomyces sp. 549]
MSLLSPTKTESHPETCPASDPASGAARRTPAATPASPTPRLLSALREDLHVVLARDPSVRSAKEAVLHPALTALWAHRVAHRMHGRGLRIPARLLARWARRVTAVEIHPGAVLGRRVFIDHGAGVVIGETAVVGDDVTMYHQVTLGAVGWWSDNKRPEGDRRHPVVGSGVVLGANSTVLGPVTLGDRAVIGAQALVNKDVPGGARVLAPTAVIREPGRRPELMEDVFTVIASAGSW